jgi:CheY-like chemotaxis protein
VCASKRAFRCPEPLNKAEGQELENARSSTLPGLRVLVVEDELIIAMELERLLRGLGSIVLDTVPTIERALRALARQRPDFAVLDVNLRGERVTPVAEALQQQGVPFVLVTGYGSERLNEEAFRDAVCLRKPIDGQRLARAMTEVLSRQEHR